MPTADIVKSWFRERIANGAVARDTEAYNQVLLALPDLIGRLGGDAVDASADVIATIAAKPPAPTK